MIVTSGAVHLIESSEQVFFFPANFAALGRNWEVKMEAKSTSETSVNFCQTTRFYNPEDNHFLIHGCENPKSC
jgi:hypothetical protein